LDGPKGIPKLFCQNAFTQPLSELCTLYPSGRLICKVIDRVKGLDLIRGVLGKDFDQMALIASIKIVSLCSPLWIKTISIGEVLGPRYVPTHWAL
jgi:hypothetical protein